ncbi:hypothetical protein COO20_14310 [Thalassospira marina]|uniref:Uncharacterized protein n=2 Tax=Thalassospira marina TaxID=2048283 RepID=A0A2N3KRU8_9PROT|nr:hypothetical protein COO20_14310 [Thalassospira marina]
MSEHQWGAAAPHFFMSENGHLFEVCGKNGQFRNNVWNLSSFPGVLFQNLFNEPANGTLVMDTSNEDHAAPARGVGYWAVIALSIVILCIGMPIFAGGVWLIMLGASSFYALAGAGLFLAGFFMMRMSMLGFWFYLLTFMGTAAWTVNDVGMDFQALFQRLAVPLIALLLVLLASPRLWRGGHSVNRETARREGGEGVVPHMAFSSPDKNV